MVSPFVSVPHHNHRASSPKRISHQHHYPFITASSFGRPFFTNRAPASLYSLLVDVMMAVLFILWWSRCLRFHHLHPSLHLPPPPAILSSTLPPSILFFLLPPPTCPLPSTISSTLVPPLRLSGLHLRTTSKHLHPSLSLHQLHHLTHPSPYLK